MAENGGGAAGCCCSFIFTSGLTALFMWLSLRTDKPTCYIQRFYVPALNGSLNSTSNQNLSFDLKLVNGMKDKGVRYDPINLTFSYPQNGSNLPVANCLLLGFYQGHGKKANRNNLTVEAVGVPWEAAEADVASNGSTPFRVDLTTRVRYKILFWYTKRERVAVHGVVRVDNSGEKVGKKKNGVKLKSKSKSPEEMGRHWIRGSVGSLAVSAFLLI